MQTPTEHMKQIPRLCLGFLCIVLLSGFTSGGTSDSKSSGNPTRKTQTVKGAGQKEIKVVILEPAEPEKQKGVCILLPPGPGNKQMVQDAERTLGKPFAKRNWRVMIPQSPDGRSFFGKNAEHITTMLSRLGNENVIMAGISNGGISALEVASANPANVKALIIVPGTLRSSRLDTRRLNGMPIFLRIGEKDELKWASTFENTVKKLTSSGARLDAKLMPNTGHVFRVNWKELDPWLENLKNSAAAQNLTPPKSLPGYRIWTDLQDREIYAKALHVQGEHVVLIRDDQRRFNFPLHKLSTEDQEFIRNNVKVVQPPPTPVPTKRPSAFQGLTPNRSDIPGPPKINFR